MSQTERLPPNFQRLDTALRSIGYSFEAAVADIIDNSVDARATRVLVRLMTTRDGHLDLAVLDNGVGMEAVTLKEAMRFGADVSKELDRLGKFGLGLKLASLSQAREVRVVTAAGGTLSGRAWLEQGISSGFECTIFDKGECQELLRGVMPDRPLGRSGTVVWWSRLYRIGQHHGKGEEQAQKLMRRLENHLAMAFHRYLEGQPRKVKIELDIFEQKSATRGIPIELDALNPFGYDRTGHNGFPAQMALHGTYKDRLKIKAHVWPPNSSAPEYKLPGGANSRQGFYFYRNNRLIQPGGWNGIREAEPHSSLARLEIDIDSEMDLEVSLDVKKAEIHLPLDLAEAIQKAKTPAGIDFRKYLAIADETYRTRTPTEAELPLIPSSGLPKDLVDFLHGELRLKVTKKHRDLKFKWKRLDKGLFFEIDRDSGLLCLNALYRSHLLHGAAGSAADVPVVKCLLFLALEPALSSERLGSKIKERMEQINRILVKAVKHERR
jgi:hypothetical protein